MKYEQTGLQEWLETGTLPTAPEGDATREVRCVRCGSTWRVPVNLDVAFRKDVAELVRAARVLEAFAAFRWAGFSPGAAKETYLHVQQHAGKCNRCEREVPMGTSEEICRCGSLNLVW